MTKRRSMKPRMLFIKQISLDFQPAENLFEPAVNKYVAAMANGETIPPVTVYHDGKLYWLKDGFHRVAAAVRCGRKRIAAEVFPGTLEDLEAEYRRELQQLHRKLREGVN